MTINDDERPLVDSNKKMGVAKASFNIVTIVMGAGVLNLPSAVSNSGWFGVIVLALMGVACAYTSALLSHCMFAPAQNSSLNKVSSYKSSSYPYAESDDDEDKREEEEEYDSGQSLQYLSPYSPQRMKKKPNYPNYTDIAQAAFGTPARIFVAFQVHLTLMGVATIFLILCTDLTLDCIEYFKEGFVRDDYIIYTTLGIAGILWFHVWFDNLSQLGNLSFLSVLATVILVIAVIVDVFQNVDPDDRGEHEFVKGGLSFWSSFVAFAFSYGAHPVLPSIVRDMKEPHKYPQMSYITFLLIGISYLPIAIIGYWGFGSDTQSPIFGNLESGPLTLVAIMTLIINLLISYAVVIKPSEEAFENVIDRYLHVNNPGFVAKLKRVASRTLFLGVTLGFALAIPNFGLALDLVASLTNTFTVFVLPCAFFSKLYWKQLKFPFHVINFLLIAIGFVACGVGTYNSIVAIIDFFQNK